MKFVSVAFLGLVTLAAIAAGVLLLVRDTSTGGSFEIILPTVTPAPKAELPHAQLEVYISGAVRNPGVYVVEEGERLFDVLEAAGGATDGADLSTINLAARVKDEDHWRIPLVGEVPQAPQPATGQAPSPAVKINVNSASVEQLISLPSIGEVKARAIISYREANGPFATVEDLLKVQGIGPATLDAIRDLVEVR